MVYQFVLRRPFELKEKRKRKKKKKKKKKGKGKGKGKKKKKRTRTRKDGLASLHAPLQFTFFNSFIILIDHVIYVLIKSS